MIFLKLQKKCATCFAKEISFAGGPWSFLGLDATAAGWQGILGFFLVGISKVMRKRCSTICFLWHTQFEMLDF